MKYSAWFYNDSTAMQLFDEIILEYNEPNINILEHIKKYTPEQRIILHIRWGVTAHTLKKEMIPIFRAVKQNHDNFAIMLDDFTFLTFLQEEKYDFFSSFEVQTLNSFKFFINCGVSDIYISGDLGFNLESLGTYCKNIGVRVRVRPNQATIHGSLESFFIRPEDMIYYENCIDVLEFASGESSKEVIGKQKVYRHIYKDLKKWIFNLSILIPNLQEAGNISNTCFMFNFGKIRRNCGFRCAYGKCDYCKSQLSLAKTLQEAGLEVIMPTPADQDALAELEK